MNDEANFSNLLSVNSDTIEKPKPLPQGTYTCTITGHEHGKSQKKGTPSIKFSMTVVAPVDIDDAELAAFGEVNGKKLSTTYFLTEDSLYRLNDFLKDACQIDGAGRSLGEMIPDTLNAQVNVTIGWRQEGENIYTDIKGISAV